MNDLKLLFKIILLVNYMLLLDEKDNKVTLARPLIIYCLKPCYLRKLSNFLMFELDVFCMSML